MSEEAGASSPTSEQGSVETLDSPSSKGKGKKSLLTMIVAVLIVVMLVGVAAWYMMKDDGGGETIDPELAATITPANPTVAAGGSVDMLCRPTVDGLNTSLPSTWTNITVRWAAVPSSVGGFDLLAQRAIVFTAGTAAATGTIWCNVTYTFDEQPDTDGTQTAKRWKNASTSVTVLAPVLQTVEVAPVSIEGLSPEPGSSWDYTAAAFDSVGNDVTADTDFEWSLSGDAVAGCTLNSTTDWIVNLTAGSTEGFVTLTVNGTYASVTVDGNLTIEINSTVPPRTVDYVWYDMFNVPFDQWRYRRGSVYGDEVPITNTYPYIYIWKGQPPGNWYRYTNLRLNITARNMSEINMLERPEFLPLFGTARGGTAQIDWNINYINERDYPNYAAPVEDNDDGWLSVINGTITLDEQAAKAVLGLSTHDQWVNFADWWTANGVGVATAWSNWFDKEAGIKNALTNPHGLDIYCAYGSGLLPISWELTATKVGETVVLGYDYVSWGGEILLTRWMRDSFMPTEWYFEGGEFHMTIGPQMADLDMDSAVSYGMYAYEETLNAGEPCWVWESIVQDYIDVLGHKSDFRKYKPFSYLNTAPGSYWYNMNMSYDYAPIAWNLTEGETLEFLWPSGNQTFLKHKAAYETLNATGEMFMEFGEPMASDNPELAPGSCVIDNDANYMLYTGPIDMWQWSYNVGQPGYRAPHDWLHSEWVRFTEERGAPLLPYGAPYLEWKMQTTGPPVIDYFTVTGAKNPINATESTGVTVTAYDNRGDVMTDYDGTINFTSSDSGAILPSDYTFQIGDYGVHAFSGIVFATEGTQDISVHDTVTTSATGSQTGIVVQSAPEADSLQVSGILTNQVVETPLSVTVTVLDQRGYLYPDYLGTVNFTSNLTYADVTLPADYTFLAGDAGTHTFTDMVVFHTAEALYTVTCTDTSDATITGSQTNIFASSGPPTLDHFEVSGPVAVAVDSAFDVTVTAYDQHGFVFTGYDGTVSFTTNATGGTYTLPGDYTFVPATDSGTHVFTGGVVFNAAGVYSVVATDATASVSASLDDIVVSAREAEIKYTMYDIMMQPWGQWYDWRYPAYSTDVVLNTNPGESTMLYNPDKTGMQGILYAPYRWNVTAKNMTTINIGSPMLMPANGTPDVPGAEAYVNVYMEYISEAWWASYWQATWSTDPEWSEVPMNKQKLDGYYLGVVYNVVMNRAAAEEWMGMPQGDDIATWWATNGDVYKSDWVNWTEWQGNEVYDIYCGYEFAYANMGTYMACTELPSGDVALEIGHISWGWEVLITRWMRAADLCQHQVYMEDLTLNAHYTSDWGDLTYDAVAQYSLKAVRANESAADDAAWEWEPMAIDYIASISGHFSDYDPWAMLTYQSHNAMDPMMGTEVAYDATPNTFNLVDYMTFEIRLRTGTNVMGYRGIAGEWWYDGGLGMDINCIINAVPLPFGLGNKINYTNAETHGWMSLGYYEASDGVTSLDLDSMFDNTTKILTIQGPCNFDNFGRGVGNPRYHGAPVIEFNVTPIVAKAAAVPTEAPVTGTGASAAAEPAVASSALISLATVAALLILVSVALGASTRLEEK